MTASAVSGVRSGRGAGRAPKLDQVCADAVGVARGGIDGIDPMHVGEHIEALAEGERVVTHLFECLQPGYRGWRWAVTVARVARSRHVTICETTLLPGPDALAAPPWVPWQDRLQPGDLGVGDILPTAPDDDRLMPGYVQSDDPAVVGCVGVGAHAERLPQGAGERQVEPAAAAAGRRRCRHRDR